MPAAPLLLACLLVPGDGGATLSFPDDPVGTLSARPRPADGERPGVSYRGGGWEPLGPARGEVEVPADSLLRLDVAETVQNLSFLEALPPDALWGVRLGPSAVGDDALPPLAKLSGLVDLNLSDTGVTETGLAALAPLDRLETLRFDLPLSDDGAERLAELPSLRSVNQPLRLSARGIAALARLPGLERLNLIGEGVTDDALAPVAGMKSLTSLWVQNAPVTDAAVESLAGVESLAELHLSGTRVSGDRLGALAGLPNLRALGLGFGGRSSDYRGDRPTLEAVGTLRNLESLDLDGGGSGPDDFADLADLSRLTFLEVRDVPFTDEAAYHVAALKSLKHLSVQEGSVSDVGVGYLVNLRDLGRVLIRGPITRAGLLRLGELPRLDLAYVSSPYLTEADGDALREAAPDIDHFQLPPYRVLTRTGFAAPYAADGFRRSGVEDRAAPDALEGEPAPPLAVENWQTADGEPLTLADFRGKVVLLDFWGTWCGPCLAAFPELKELRERFGPDGFEIVGVHTTAGAAEMAGYLAENPLPWPNAADADRATAAAYGVPSYPGVYLIDRAGTLRCAALHRPDAARAIECLLAEPAGDGAADAAG